MRTGNAPASALSFAYRPLDALIASDGSTAPLDVPHLAARIQIGREPVEALQDALAVDRGAFAKAWRAHACAIEMKCVLVHVQSVGALACASRVAYHGALA